MPSTDTPMRGPTHLRDAPDKLRLLARWFDMRDASHRPISLAELPPHEHARCGVCDRAAEQVAAGDEIQRDLRHWADMIERVDQSVWPIIAAIMLLSAALCLGFALGTVL